MGTNIYHIHHTRTDGVIVISTTRKGEKSVYAVPSIGKIPFLASL